MMSNYSIRRIRKGISEHGSELQFRISRTTVATYRRFIAFCSNRKRKTILFYPEKPKYLHSAYVACYMLGYRITNNPDRTADAAIRFEDTTVADDDPMIRTIAGRMPFLNRDCSDIRKTKVEEVFRETFGYGMSVDPEVHVGECVRKSDENATHDGKIIMCPARREPDYVYQKLIDTRVGDETVDIRVLVFKGSMPFVVYRYKDLSDRFDITTRISIHNTDEVLSSDEQRKILDFCERFGMDYGELDILRDNEDGRIYIVDANKTPSGPRICPGISKETCDEFYGRMCRAFEDMITLSKTP